MRLLNAFGPQRWWPARTRLEVILGAILTQNTSWNNAARAIARLRKAGLLNLEALETASNARLERCLRPAGYFRQKAKTVRAFLEWLERDSHGSLTRLFARSDEKLRQDLLQVRGFGPETVDSILLYAGGLPYFVVDAYTKRILSRHGLIPENTGYAEVQAFFHENLPRDARLYNEFHALLVEVGKRFCRPRKPKCEVCPLQGFLPSGQVTTGVVLPPEPSRSGKAPTRD